MVKCLYVVSVDNYFPELTQYTLRNLEAFASKINSDFSVIDERKFPEYPPTYEKLQIFELGKANDYNILVDADSMFHKDMEDPTLLVPPDHFGSFMQFDASLLFEPDEYFFRDGRRIGVASTFMVVPRALHDIWTPLEFSVEEARERTKRWFIIDEYCISRNVARFGLKSTGLLGDEFQHLLKHFDVNSKTPDRDAVVEEARKFYEEHTI